MVKVSIPRDHVAFQIGETAQIHSGGILQVHPAEHAPPHTMCANGV